MAKPILITVHVKGKDATVQTGGLDLEEEADLRLVIDLLTQAALSLREDRLVKMLVEKRLALDGEEEGSGA